MTEVLMAEVVGLCSSNARDVLRQEQSVSLPWVEKYRPSTLDDVIAHDDIVSTINRFIDADRLPHLLFYGPPGTGKTSTVLAVAKQLYGKNLPSMCLQLNASDERGIDVVRDQIKEFASTRTIFASKHKLIILDEADAMTSAAQMSLRRVIEKYTRNTRFCILCNYISKIIPALQSRCTRFRFAPLTAEQMKDRLSYIISQENVYVSASGVDALITLSQGDMRRAVNLLQSTALACDQVDEVSVYRCSGNPLPVDIDNIYRWMLNDPFQIAFLKIEDLKVNNGLALSDILRCLHSELHRINFPPSVVSFLLSELAEVEFRLLVGTSEKIQLSSLVGVFRQAAARAVQLQQTM